MIETDREMFALELLGESMWRGLWSILHQIQRPVLFLAGESEDSEGNNRRAASIMPDAVSVTFKGLGHVGAYLRSDLALSHVVPFLRATCDLRRESSNERDSAHSFAGDDDGRGLRKHAGILARIRVISEDGSWRGLSRSVQEL